MPSTARSAAWSLVALVLASGPSGQGKTAGSPPSSTPPKLLAPPHRDSVSIESEPAPFLQPGAPAPRDATVKTARDLALEQFTLGVVMEQQGNFPAALFAFTNASKFDSTLQEASYRHGLLELKWGRTKEAEEAFREELRRSPGHAGASRELALLLSQRGKHQDAIARVKPLTVRQPRDDQNWYALGVVYENAGRHAEAEAALRKAIALPPDRGAEHRDLGVVLVKLGRSREAGIQYRTAIALDPRDPNVWLNLGNLHARAGRPDSAIVAYRRSTDVDSAFTLGYKAQVTVLTEMKRFDEVADTYMRWIEVQPDDIELRLTAVRHLAEVGRRDRALEIGRDGVRQHPKAPAAHLILGMSLEAYGSTREAVAELRTAESLFVAKRDKQRVQALIKSMRGAAPDSLRAMFAADSAAHPVTAR